MKELNVIVRGISVLIAMMGMSACHAPSKKGFQEEMTQVQDSLKAGRYESARQMIAQHLEEAVDSDTYYRWLSMQNVAWYAEMNVDSMKAVGERIHQYLLRNRGDQSKAKRQLWAEWLKARGVFHYAVLGQIDSAIIYTDSALYAMDGIEEANDLRLTSLTNRAFFYQQSGQFDKSADGYLYALAAADSMGKGGDTKNALMLGISTVYTFMGDYAGSALWWERTRELLPSMIKADQNIYYNSRGNDFYFQQKYPEARDCFIQSAQLVKDDSGKAWDYYTALINLGQVYICLGMADSARVLIHQADSFFRKVDFKPIQYYIETSKMELEMLEGHTDRALYMLNHHEAPDPMIPEAKVQRLKAVEQVMRETGNYKVAYEASRQMHALNDSIKQANVSMQLSTRLMEFEHDKRLIEQQRTLDKEHADKLLAWGLFLLVLMTAIILGGILLLYRRRHRMHELETRQQIVSMRMENTRNRITPHFIYNALNHEVLAQMEGRRVDLNALTGLLRRGVYQADMLQTTLDEELSFVDYYVEIEGRQMGPDFYYRKDVAEDVDIKNVRLPAMVVQIFAENALKHGLRPLKVQDGGKKILNIRVRRKERATLVEVLDNGMGLQVESGSSSKTGLRVVRQTIQLLNERNKNQITFGVTNRLDDGESGCRSWILLPDEYDYQLMTQD